MPVSLHSSVARLLLPAALALGISACSFPGVYKLDVQQGNIVTQDMVNQLKPGMDKHQVRYILGTPLLIDSFHEDRWDYFYSLKNHGEDYSQERLTLFFADDHLVNMKGNFRPTAAGTASPAQAASGQTVPASKAAAADTLESRERKSDVKVYPINTPPTPQPAP